VNYKGEIKVRTEPTIRWSSRIRE